LAFVDIAFHRRGPEDLPASTFLLVLVVAVYVFVASLALHLAPPVERAALLLALDTTVYCGFIWGVLKSFNRERRFRQTAVALFGADTLINLLSVPLLLWGGGLEAADATPPAAAIAVLLLLCWQIDIAGYVLSRAIERPYVVGVSIMIAYVLLSFSVRASLSPPAAG
jgi:hypothetical protein